MSQKENLTGQVFNGIKNMGVNGIMGINEINEINEIRYTNTGIQYVNKKSFALLTSAREEYSHICWESKNGRLTKITDLEDSHLINIIKSVGTSAMLAEHLPQVEELKSYNGIPYTLWREYLINEYLYRAEVMEAEYEEAMERSYMTQLQYDRDYYDDRDYMSSYGECF